MTVAMLQFERALRHSDDLNADFDRAQHLSS